MIFICKVVPDQTGIAGMICGECVLTWPLVVVQIYNVVPLKIL